MRWSEIKGTTYILSDSGIVRNTKTGKVLKPKARKYPGVRGRVVLQYKNGEVVARHRSLASAARAIGLAKPNNGGASHIKRACESNGVKILFGFTFAYEKEGDSYQVE